MNTPVRRLLMSAVTVASLLALSACHHKAAAQSPSTGTTSAAPSTAPPASGATSGSTSGMAGSGGHHAPGTKKGSMANACGASNGS